MSSPSNSEEYAIVVGSGLAGLSAASKLIAQEIPVYLFERAPKTGGNSIKASSGINGAPTIYQPGPDTSFFSDTIKSAGQALSTSNTKEREHLISTLINSSSDAINWLVNEQGVDLSVVAQLGGHSFPRTHRGSGKTPPGAAIVVALLNSLKASPLFHLKTSCLVTKVLQEDSSVTGVEYKSEGESETQALKGPVIFASGGFAGDAYGMLAKYRPDLTGFPSTNDRREGSHKLLTSVGAKVLDMDLVQVHPTAFVDPKDTSSPVKFLAAELLRGEGGVLLVDGERFIDEMETRKIVTAAITAKPVADKLPRQWNVQLVLDEGAYTKASSHIDFYLWKGLMRKSKVEELDGGLRAIGSLQEYADAAAGKTNDKFGRKSFGYWSLQTVTPESIIYVGRVTPAIHFTMGGVLINEKSQILDTSGQPIEGIWAAGEITGGIHGDNRLGGSSLLECVVFGRIAGEGAGSAWKAKS